MESFNAWAFVFGFDRCYSYFQVGETKGTLNNLQRFLLISQVFVQVVNYEVIHYPHPQHVEQHIEHPPPSSGWENPGYGRQITAQEMAYNAYLR